MQLRLIRHATLAVEIAGRRLLIDPMLVEAGSAPPVEGSTNDRRNPLVALPVSVSELVDGLDGVLITHTHSDHLDPASAGALARALPLLCQPPDERALRERGFTDVRPVASELDWDGLRVSRTSGRHGSGQIGDEMGPVSGFVLAAAGEPTLLIAGDTIWCDELRAALEQHRPDVVVVNAGAAQLAEGGPITMTAGDVIETARFAPDARVVAVHMEAINHCLLTRADLRAELEAAGLGERVLLPEDGQQPAL